jgi:hypothetical protein
MLWNVQILFEAATSPGQKGSPVISQVVDQWAAFATDPAIQFFYPTGTQLSGSQVPAGSYAQPVYPGDPTNFSSTWTGPGGPAPPSAPGSGTRPVS